VLGMVCVYACVCVWVLGMSSSVQVNIFTKQHACTHKHMRTLAHTHKHTHAHFHTHTHTCAHSHTHTHMRTLTHTCAHSHMRTLTQTNTHTHGCAQKHHPKKYDPTHLHRHTDNRHTHTLITDTHTCAHKPHTSLTPLTQCLPTALQLPITYTCTPPTHSAHPHLQLPNPLSSISTSMPHRAP